MGTRDDLGWRSDFGRVAVTDEWHRIEFARDFELPPAVFASIQTFHGADTASVRMRNLDTAGVDVRVEEERSADDDTTHVEETVGYVAIPPAYSFLQESFDGVKVRSMPDGYDLSGWREFIYQPDRQPDFETTGKTADYDEADTRAYRTMQPVAFTQLASANGPDPAHTRVRNVDADSFEFRIEEWSYLNGAHVEEAFGIAVLPNTLYAPNPDDSSLLYVGTTDADHQWTTVDLDAHVRDNGNVSLGNATWAETVAGHDAVVIARCQTYNGHQPVVTRLRNVSPDGFEVRLQEEEANNDLHKTETVGFMVVVYPERDDESGGDESSALESVPMDDIELPDEIASPTSRDEKLIERIQELQNR